VAVEAFRDFHHERVREEYEKVVRAGRMVIETGMQFNAGHGLNYRNVQAIAAIGGISELHIGHSIVSRAVFVGMREAVREMKRLMVEAAMNPELFSL